MNGKWGPVINLHHLTHPLENGIDVHRERTLQDSFIFPAADGQIAMRGNIDGLLLEVIILLKLRRLLRGVIDRLGHHHAVGGEILARKGPDFSIFRRQFGHDVTGAGQGIRLRLHFLFRVDKGPGRLIGISRHRLLENQLGERIEPLLPGNHGARPAFGLERQIQILERVLRGAGQDFRLQVVR